MFTGSRDVSVDTSLGGHHLTHSVPSLPPPREPFFLKSLPFLSSFLLLFRCSLGLSPLLAVTRHVKLPTAVLRRRAEQPIGRPGVERGEGHTLQFTWWIRIPVQRSPKSALKSEVPLPQNVALFGNGVSAGVITMGRGHPGVGRAPNSR